MADRADGRDTVLFVSALSFLGGAQVSLASVIGALDPDVRVVVAAPATGVLVDRLEAQRRVDEFLPIAQRSRGTVLRSRMSAAVVLGRWLWRHRRRLRAVHANGDAEMKLLLPLVPLIPVPIVVWFHRAELTDTTTRLRPIWQRLRRRVVWAAVSEARRAELLEARVGSVRNTVVVPNPIDPELVVPEKHVPSGRFVVGYLGSEYAAKGFLLLPDIAERLRDLPLTLLCVVKDLRPEQMTPDIVDALEHLRAMPELVSFRARNFEVRHIFAELDAVLVPSYSESFCRVAAEGMLNGLPVVGSDLPAVRELLHPDAGLLFTAGDAAGAAARIRRLVEDPELAGTLGAVGRRRASRFAPRSVAAQLERMYRLRLPVDVSLVGERT